MVRISSSFEVRSVVRIISTIKPLILNCGDNECCIALFSILYQSLGTASTFIIVLWILKSGIFKNVL